ncbi:hypothetical protein PMZ80_003484 [Knufia obscura]|uniref:Uncharacterized protein n=1 Tax=Knufia obscura TaxID=1635080 RepID=A0ABR0RUD0_9EURO|nr:hypothetical protein PMZ80_003484 [Knufia obscura]
MCFYTTYLFSLCGHISISSKPIKHTKPCSKASSTPSSTNPTSQEPDTPTSVHAFTTSFPSPQEFEFAKQLHNSTPASPTSPIPTAAKPNDADGTDIIDAYGTSPPTSLHNGKSDSKSNPGNEPPLTPAPCPNPTRHPLHTYILPFLCPACHRARVENIAHFEAQTIRETVEREAKFGYSKNGVVDPERKKISRRSAARRKGELIALICVEEGRLGREGGVVEPVGETSGGVGVGGEDGNGSGVVSGVVEQEQEQDEESRKLIEEMEQMNAQIQVGATGMGSGSAVVVKADKDKDRSADVGSRDSQSQNVSAATSNTAAATAATSGWSWWGRSTASASTPVSNSTSPAHAKGVSPVSTTQKQDLKHKKTASRISMSSPRPASPRVNVPRDVLGRNQKGMNRIMGWDGGGT